MSQIRADNITNRQGTGAPIFVNGIRVVGLTSIANVVANTGTFSGAVSIGGTLTYEDVTNVDSIGIVTARDGIDSPTNLVLRTGGSEKVRIKSDGKVVIGDSNTTAQLGVVRDSYYLAEFTNTNADATGAELTLRKDSASPADNDSLGILNFIGDNDAGQKTTYTYIRSKSTDVTDGTEDGILEFHTRGNGTLTERLRITTSGVKVTGGYTENIVAVSGTAVDCATGSYFTKTITGATTFTFTNVPTGVAYAFTFEVTLNGSNAITWPASVKWPADTAPTITDGKTQVFVFLTDDGGTRWRGSSLVDYTN